MRAAPDDRPARVCFTCQTAFASLVECTTREAIHSSRSDLRYLIRLPMRQKAGPNPITRHLSRLRSLHFRYSAVSACVSIAGRLRFADVRLIANGHDRVSRSCGRGSVNRNKLFSAHHFPGNALNCFRLKSPEFAGLLRSLSECHRRMVSTERFYPACLSSDVL
jgi:hypothetical protein